MKVFRSVAKVPANFGPTVAVIGNFDGVHLGHQQVIGAVTSEARSKGYRSVAVTFDPHPEQFLRPEQAAGLLTPIPERLRMLARTGIDAVLILPFDDELACLSARDCVQSIFVKALGVRSIHEGANFRFGHHAEAGVSELEEFGREFGFSVTVHEAVRTHGMTVSSTAIRQAVAAGDMRRARWMLGHTFSVRSSPARGRGIGTRLLVPTVNLASYPGLLPEFGVYVTRLTIFDAPGLAASGLDTTGLDSEPGRCFQSITNVGNRPTFGQASFAVESHILNFEPVDLTDETPLELEFLLRLRPEITWPSPEALKAQIGLDVARARRFHQLTGVLQLATQR